MIPNVYNVYTFDLWCYATTSLHSTFPEAENAMCKSSLSTRVIWMYTRYNATLYHVKLRDSHFSSRSSVLESGRVSSSGRTTPEKGVPETDEAVLSIKQSKKC